MQSRRVTRYVMPLREGGSLPGLVEADDDGLYVAKLRGAGQGVRALVAEVIAGELARALGLRVPLQVALELDPALGAAEPDPEVQDLLRASAGVNVGVDFLPGALPYTPAAGRHPAPEEAAEIVWLDALTANVDRTAANPNLLWWHDGLWLIDHGAALYHHHADGDLVVAARRPVPQVADHVLAPVAGPLGAAHERLAPRVTRELLERVVAEVPDGWAGDRDYVGYLLARREAVVDDLG